MSINRAKEYLKSFSEKNISKLYSLFSKNIILRDWNANNKGIENVIKQNKILFNKSKIIKIKTLKIFKYKKTVVAELLVSIDKSKPLFVVDVIDFDKNNKIKFIRAYIGN